MLIGFTQAFIALYATAYMAWTAYCYWFGIWQPSWGEKSFADFAFLWRFVTVWIPMTWIYVLPLYLAIAGVLFVIQAARLRRQAPPQKSWGQMTEERLERIHAANHTNPDPPTP